MAIKDTKSVDSYVKMVCEMRAALENLQEFVDSLPAPDDEHSIPGMDYGHFGDVTRMHELIGELGEISSEMFG